MKLPSNDALSLVEIWVGIKNYIPPKDQRQAAERYITDLEEHGLVDFSVDDHDFYGVCETFDSVLEVYREEQGYVALEKEELDLDWEE